MNIRNFNNKKNGKQIDLFQSVSRLNQQNIVDDKQLQKYQQKQNIDVDKLQKVLDIRSKQFKFDCGAIMASISYDCETSFGLKYHADLSTDENDFINRISRMISATGEKITENDEKRLRIEYKAYVNE